MSMFKYLGGLVMENHKENLPATKNGHSSGVIAELCLTQEGTGLPHFLGSPWLSYSRQFLRYVLTS